METKLKPCPFCGGAADYREVNYSGCSGRDGVYVYCKRCKIETAVMYRSLNYCAKDEAAKLWNSRVDQQKL